METPDRSPEAAPDETSGIIPRGPALTSEVGRAALWPAALAAGLIAGIAA